MSSKELARKTAIALVTFQLYSRLLTFLLNAVVIRLTSPRVLGIAVIKLELLYNAAVFLSREGIRLALLRYTPSPGQDETSWLCTLAHMSWLALPFSAPVMLFLGLAYGLSIPNDIIDAGLKHLYCLALGIYAVGALVELAAEPCYMLFVHRNQVQLRIRAESTALTLRAVALLGSCVLVARMGGEHYSDLQRGLIAFPIGQIIYFSSLFSVLWRGFGQAAPVPISLLSLLPYPNIKVDTRIIEQAHATTAQVFLKYLLSQGDMWILSLLAPLQDQGVYAVVSNYGSLICRILLQPMEEATLAFISGSISKEALQRVKGHCPREKRREAFEYLAAVLKLDLLLSVGVLVYGPALARPLIAGVLGTRWLASEMPEALIAYCFLIPVMAFSGILEAFVNATLESSDRSHYRKGTLLTTLVFVLISVVLTRAFGSVGLIVGNIANFGMRASYGSWYLHRYMRRHLEANFARTFYTNVLLHRALGIYSAILAVVFTAVCFLGRDSGPFALFRNATVLASLPVTLFAIYLCEPQMIASLGLLRRRERNVEKET